MTRKRGNRRRRTRRRGAFNVPRRPSQNGRVLANALHPWTTSPTPCFNTNNSYISRQSLFIPGEAVVKIQTDANGEAAFAFHPTSNGQYAWVTSDEVAFSSNTWTPDFTAAANDLVSDTGPMASSQNKYLLSAGFEYIPALALDQAGGYGLASLYSRKDEIGTIGNTTIRPGHDNYFNIRKPLTFISKSHGGNTVNTNEISDASASHGEIVVLRFSGPVSSVIGYVHLRQVSEVILDPTESYGHHPERHRHLELHRKHITERTPSFFATSKDKAVAWLTNQAYKVADFGINELSKHGKQLLAGLVGGAAGVLTENPMVATGTYNATLALEDEIIELVN